MSTRLFVSTSAISGAGDGISDVGDCSLLDMEVDWDVNDNVDAGGDCGICTDVVLSESHSLVWVFGINRDPEACREWVFSLSGEGALSGDLFARGEDPDARLSRKIGMAV